MRRLICTDKILTKIYVTGSVGVLWSLCWFLFVFETPAKHPRISDEERKEIEDAIGKIFYINYKDIPVKFVAHYFLK